MYRMLSTPLHELEGRAPIDALTADNLDEIAAFVDEALGIDRVRLIRIGGQSWLRGRLP